MMITQTELTGRLASLLAYQELVGQIGLLTNQERVSLAFLAGCGSSGESVTQLSDEQRAWFADACLDLTGQTAAIDAINAGRGLKPRVPYRNSSTGIPVCKADLLTDPFTYAEFYPVLHNCPFVLVSQFEGG